jgi:hypothetical protein
MVGGRGRCLGRAEYTHWVCGTKHVTRCSICIVVVVNRIKRVAKRECSNRPINQWILPAAVVSS